MVSLVKLLNLYASASKQEHRERLVEMLVRRIEDKLRLFIGKRCGFHEADTSDVLQVTLLSILKSAPRFQGTTKAAFWKFCYTIARRRLADYYRVKRRLPLPIPPEEIVKWAERSGQLAADTLSQLEEVVAMLKKLGPKCYELLCQRYLAELSVGLIAEALALREDTAQRQINRCLDEARKRFKKRF